MPVDLRNIEKAWRAAWMRAIAAGLPGPRTTTLPDVTRTPLKVLFVRYERIGDMIMSTGMIRVLASAHQNITLDVLANPSTRPVLENNPYIRKVFTLDRKSWSSYRKVGAALRREQYDVIVDGRINNPPIFTSTPLLMRMAKAPYRVGVGGGYNNLVYNVRVAPYDRATSYVKASQSLSIPFGVDIDAVDWQPEIFLTEDERTRATTIWQTAARMSGGDAPRFLINLSASEAKRRWSDDNFIAVLQAVRERHPHMPIVVMGLPNEWTSVERVANAVNAYAAPTPKLRDALALVGTSDRVFTPDTSISHAASAFRRPAVVLLKREHAPYAPWNTPGDIVFWDGDTIHGLPIPNVRDAVLKLVP